jgi:hypothetical protein
MKNKRELLFENYPQLFELIKLENKKCSTNFGIMRGDGWLDLLESLCRQIQCHVDVESKKNEKYEIAKFLQIKEKFGALRVYVKSNDPYVHGLIRMAEAISVKMCQLCGSPGKLKTAGWMKVRCENCNESVRTQYDDVIE